MFIIMKRNKTIKIKRSKSRLYKKRKSPVKTVAETVVLVIVAAGLVYVGYSAAGPIIDHLSSGDSGTVTNWAPATDPVESDPEGTQDDALSEDNTTLPDNSENLGSYLLSETALSSSAALSAQVKAAKELGFNEIIVPLKKTSGDLLYRSNIEYIKDTELITGTMPANQIISLIKAQDMTAKAFLPTLMDANSASYVDDACYRIADGSTNWLDAAAAYGGKRWLDPFLDGTRKYYEDLAKELSNAGFEEIILSQLRFPNFVQYDQQLLDPRNFTSTRYTELTALFNAVNNASGKKSAVSMDIKDVLSGYGQSFGATAELLTDRSFTGTVYLMVNLNDFTENRLEIGENRYTGLSPVAEQKAMTLINKAAEYIGTNVTIVPVINAEGITSDELVKCYRQLTAE